jgi:hypothetical protein
MADMQPQGEVRTHPDGMISHEANRVQVREILGFTLALIVLAGVIHFVLALVMQRFSKEESKLQTQRPPLFALTVDVPTPHLQGNPAADLARLKTQSLDRLTTYGWVNREAGIAHIPIDRAMDILARSGLPKVAAPPNPSPETKTFGSKSSPHSEARSQDTSGRKP